MSPEPPKAPDSSDRTRNPTKAEIEGDISIYATPDEVLQAIIGYRPDR